MRFILITLVVLYTQIINSQTPRDTIGFPIKKVYKICSHSPQDTTFIYSFYYNENHQLVRTDKVKKNDAVNYFTTYTYDSLGKRTMQQFHIVFNFTYSNYDNQSKWASNIIGVYGQKNTYQYDTIKKEITINEDFGRVNKQCFDSVFNDSKLIALYDKNDTTTFEYDNKGRLLYERTNKYNRKTLKKYKYKKDDIYISTYRINKKKQLIKTTYLKYNNNQLVQKNEIEKVDSRFNKWYRAKPMDYYCNSTFTYENNRLISFKQESFTGDNGADECGANFIEIYKYE